MARGIVVFERDERYVRGNKPELDYRLIRSMLPVGAVPLAIADRDGFAVICGTFFYREQVSIFASEQSGYRSEPVDIKE